MLYEVYNRILDRKVLLPVANYNNFDINIRWMADYIYPESILKSFSDLYIDFDIKSFEQIDRETSEAKKFLSLHLAIMNSFSCTKHQTSNRRNFRF